jgi:hypothetical protein
MQNAYTRGQACRRRPPLRNLNPEAKMFKGAVL